MKSLTTIICKNINMLSYFFIPGNHQRLKEKILSTDADEIIVDIEDAVREHEINDILDQFVDKEITNKLFIRPNLFKEGRLNNELLTILLKKGFVKYVIPKFSSISELQEIEKHIEFDYLKKYEFILLIENPKSLLFLKEILQETKLNIVGLGFGSHDYCLETGLSHKPKYLRYPRFLISAIAKVFGLVSIDIASMEIRGEKVFEEEIYEGMALGFDAKFIIHPAQLKILTTFSKFDSNEIMKAKEILNRYKDLGKPPVFVHEGKVIEPPHIKQLKQLIKKINK